MVLTRDILNQGWWLSYPILITNIIFKQFISKKLLGVSYFIVIPFLRWQKKNEPPMTRMPGHQMFMFGISFNFLWQIPASVSLWINIYSAEWIQTWKSYTNTPCCFLLMNGSLDRRTSCARGHATLLAVAPWVSLQEHLSLPHTTHPSVISKAKIKTNLCGFVSLPHRHALMRQKATLHCSVSEKQR